MEIEDYTDPVCPFCTDMFVTKVHRIPTDRVISKLDEYFGKNDYQGAERHLLYWLSEAESEGDDNGVFTVKNELMGLYRKLGRLDNAEQNSKDALALVEKLGIDGSISAATAYLNSGTVYKAMNDPQKSIAFFEKAKKIYENLLEKSDSRLGGLYNNMALTLVDLKDFERADFYYKKALEIMKDKKNGLLDCAITYLNMADAAAARLGLENAEAEISELLDMAQKSIDSAENIRDGYYAFVCEKCAPSFGYYGYFLNENELKERAKEIYERA